jgi:NADPH2:quinone reductase
VYAIRLHTFGPPENLRYEEVDDPQPGADEVRIAVAAAAHAALEGRATMGKVILLPERAA